MEYVLSRKHKTEVNFVLGLQGNMSKMINKEAERHQDILVVNVLDSYMNLTLKSVFMLKYLSDISGLYESLQTALKVHSRKRNGKTVQKIILFFTPHLRLLHLKNFQSMVEYSILNQVCVNCTFHLILVHPFYVLFSANAQNILNNFNLIRQVNDSLRTCSYLLDVALCKVYWPIQNNII